MWGFHHRLTFGKTNSWTLRWRRWSNRGYWWVKVKSGPRARVGPTRKPGGEFSKRCTLVETMRRDALPSYWAWYRGWEVGMAFSICLRHFCLFIGSFERPMRRWCVATRWASMFVCSVHVCMCASVQVSARSHPYREIATDMNKSDQQLLPFVFSQGSEVRFRRTLLLSFNKNNTAYSLNFTEKSFNFSKIA